MLPGGGMLMAELSRRGLGIAVVGFVLNLPWEVLQMSLYAAPGTAFIPAVRSHVGPALVDALIILAIYGVGALLFGGPRWTLGMGPRRWGFLLAAGALAAMGIEWRALNLTGAWAYAPAMPRVPGVGVGLLPLLQMLLLPAASLISVPAILHRWASRRRLRSPRTGAGPAGPSCRGAFPSALVVVGAFVLAAAATATSAQAAGLAAPLSLGQLKLGHALQGEKARDEIHRLHGKAIPFRDALVAHYEGAGGVAMLYVSEAGDEEMARQQVEQMTARIRPGDGAFTHLRERIQGGITVYSSLGQGQVHYYFRRGVRVIWVAADAPVARSALADALRIYP